MDTIEIESLDTSPTIHIQSYTSSTVRDLYINELINDYISKHGTELTEDNVRSLYNNLLITEDVHRLKSDINDFKR
jgi:hypothetical protein